MLLRGPKTILVDPGIHLQNEPVIRALEARDLGVDDLDFIALTHAHLDHAGACADVPGQVVVHELELDDPDRPMVAGILPRERLRLLSGDEGELEPGITWARTPGHTEGGVCYRVETGRRSWSCSPATPSARCAKTTNGWSPAPTTAPTPCSPPRGGRSPRGARRARSRARAALSPSS